MTLNGQNRTLQFTGDSKNWQASFSGLEANQRYTGEISIKDNAGRTSTVALEFETFTLRADGLLALYSFEEGSGAPRAHYAENSREGEAPKPFQDAGKGFTRARR